MLMPSGRWNGHILLVVCCGADVIAQWQMEWPLQAVSVPSWQMLFPGGQMDILGRITLVSVLRCYAKPHPIYEADGTCLCFYLGMDCLPLYIMLLLSICRGSGLPSLQC